MVHKLNAEHFCLVEDIFNGFPYDPVFRDLAVNGREGNLFVDNVARPTAALLRSPRTGVSLIAGDVGQADELILALPELLAGLSLRLVSTPSDGWRDKIISALGKLAWEFPRVSYRFTGERNDWIKTWRTRVPEACKVVQMDQELARLASADPELEFGTNPDTFAGNHIGFAVLNGDRVASVAHSGAPPTQIIDVAVGTAVAFRRRGYALLAGCALIERCLQHGIIPHVGTGKKNDGARAWAVKLGFGDQQFHSWIGVR